MRAKEKNCTVITIMLGYVLTPMLSATLRSLSSGQPTEFPEVQSHAS